MENTSALSVAPKTRPRSASDVAVWIAVVAGHLGEDVGNAHHEEAAKRQSAGRGDPEPANPRELHTAAARNRDVMLLYLDGSPDGEPHNQASNGVADHQVPRAAIPETKWSL